MGEPNASDNIFVGDLPLEITMEHVKTVFASYGSVVQARVLQPKRPGQKASALVRFGSVEEATWVVQNLNGNLAEGLDEPILVRFANAPGATPTATAGGQSHWQSPAGKAPVQPQQNQSQKSDNIFVGDLPAEVTNEQVKMIFSNYGSVTQSRALAPKQPGGKASALVRFDSAEEAAWVVANLNGNLAEGLHEPVVVRFANATNTSGQSWSGSYGATQTFAQGKGSFRNQPYSNGATQGEFAGQKRQGVPDTFYAYFSGLKKAGILGEPRITEDCQVYVKNLPTDTTDADLYKVFSPFGPIAPGGVKAMVHADGSCKGFGFVDFMDPSHAEAAIAALQDFTLPDGSNIIPSIKAKKNGDESGVEPRLKKGVPQAQVGAW